MKRFARIFLYAASTLSLLLSIAFLVVWIRSHYVEDYCEILDKFKPSVGGGKVEAHSRRVSIDSTNGRLRISSADQSLGQYTVEQAQVFRESRTVSWSHIKPHAEPNKWLRTGPEGRLNALGFYLWSGVQKSRNSMLMRVIGFPWLAPTLLFALLPLLQISLLLRRRMSRRQGFDVMPTATVSTPCAPAP